jgi:hypothetical protein
MKSKCYDCALLHSARCPLEKVLEKHDMVVFVDECGRWRRK